MASILEKIQKVEALIEHAGTEGERQAAILAKERLEKLKSKVEIEYTIRTNDMWHKKLFAAICHKYKLNTYRYYRQKLKAYKQEKRRKEIFEKCTQAKAKFLAAADSAIANIDNLIKNLKALKEIESRVQGNEDLTNEEEANMTADLTAEIAKINGIKAKINTTTNMEDLLIASRELLDAFEGSCLNNSKWK